MNLLAVRSRLSALTIAIVAFTNNSQTLFAGDRTPNGESTSKATNHSIREKELNENIKDLIEEHKLINAAHPPNFDLPAPRSNAFFPNNNASGESKRLQQMIAKTLELLCTPNQARSTHFSWLSNYDMVRKNHSKLIGWSSVILEAKELPGNGWIAKVRVRPYLSNVGRSAVLDYVDETYRYQDGKLVFVDTDANIPDPKKRQLISIY